MRIRAFGCVTTFLLFHISSTLAIEVALVTLILNTLG